MEVVRRRVGLHPYDSVVLRPHACTGTDGLIAKAREQMEIGLDQVRIENAMKLRRWNPWTMCAWNQKPVDQNMLLADGQDWDATPLKTAGMP